MKQKMKISGIVFAALLCFAVTDSQAIYLHNFSCDNCHGAGISLYSTGNANLCTHCHRTGGDTIVTDDGRAGPTTFLDVNDLSNAFGSHSDINAGAGPSEQTSHTWATNRDRVRPAGSTSSLSYNTRYGASDGKITCSKCHNPHATFVGTPGANAPPGSNKALRLDNTGDALCADCHLQWYNAPTNALETHPVGITYTGTGLNPSISDPKVQLVNNGTDDVVSCSTCHNVHWSDSNGGTTDGREGNHSTGDGKLLVTDGRDVNPNTLCQACHSYQHHGAGQVGCLDCHSGHSYNGGSVNYYVLRSEISGVWNVKGVGGTLQKTDISGFDYSSQTAMWKNGGAGYCEGCHTLTADHNGFTVGGKTDCQGCHSHNASTGAFGGACNSCHGYAPSTSTRVGAAPETGPAIISTGTYSAYNEANTPHINHSDPLTNSSPNHNLACTECHVNFPTGHSTDGTGSVDFAFGFDAQTGTANPVFNSGNCSNVYCHSNGNDGNFQTVGWANGRDTITGCTACHGNTSATMDKSGTTNDNTLAHGAHLDRYNNNCSVCHVLTATNNTTLVRTGTLNSITPEHVDCRANVAFNESFSLGTDTLGTGNDYQSTSDCSTVYCHSNGQGSYPNPSPTWTDTGEAGKCGACHQVSATLEGASLTINGATLGGAHEAHVVDTLGPLIACDVCHTHTVMGASDHINGAVNLKTNYQTTVCNPCHGSSNGTTSGNDRQPVWTNTATVDCETCHTGSVVADFSVISGPTAPDRSSATTTGHNKPSGNYLVSGNPAAAQSCLACHDSGGAGHFDGSSGDDKRLVTGFDCQTCHGVDGSATKNNVVSHKAKSCEVCHDPHGGGGSNIYMIRGANRSGGSDFAGTVVFTGKTGTNSYDENDSGANANNDDLCATCHTATTHNNRALTGDPHNEGTACIGCHKDHYEPTGAFIAGAGNSCDGCHGFPPVSGPGAGAHALHAPISKALDDAGLVELPVDVSACDDCHTGAALYTYDPSADRSSGTANRTNHGAGDANQKSVLNSAVGYNLTDFNCTSACHTSTAADGTWIDTALNCNACHFYASGTSLTSTNNTSAANSVGGSHGTHFDISTSVACTDCHTVDSADAALTHITTAASGTELAKMQGRAAAVQFEATVISGVLGADGVDPTAAGSNATCNNIACHNPSGAVSTTSYSAEWGVDTASCSLCHAGSAGDPGTGSHTAHLGASTNFGITIGCASCHGTLPTSNKHRNASIALTVLADPGTDYMDGTSAADLTDFASTSWGTCDTATCHNDGTGTAVVSPKWGTTSANCSICHSAAPTSAKHAEHRNNVTFVPDVATAGPQDIDCDNCHGTDAEQASTHINDAVNTGLRVTAYTGSGGAAGSKFTCTNACHLGDTENDWTASGALACADCHGSGKNTSGFAASSSQLDRGWPPGSGAHGNHVGNAYVADNCVDCHNDNTSGHSGIEGTATAATGAKLTANPGNGTCTNTCHVAADTNDWTAGTRTCTDCHSGSYIGGNDHAGSGNNYLPQTGLHTGTLTVSANTHDDSFDDGGTGTATCTTCHTATPSTAHVNGVWTNSWNSSGASINFAADVGFTDGTTPTCGPGTSLSSCHDDGGAWKRKWSTTAKLNDGSECANCHGDFNYGFVSGMAARHQTASSGDTDGDVGNQHDGTDKCYLCHTYKSGDTTYYTFGTDHQDGTIQLNNQVGFQDNGATVGCSGCHTFNDGTNDEQHDFQDTATDSGGLSRWGRELRGGPVADCNSCHTSNGVNHTGGTESSTIHDLHNNSAYTTACNNCHLNNGPGGTGHNTGTVNFGGTYMASDIDYVRTNNFGGSCSGAGINSCHDSDAGEWKAGVLDNAGDDACEDCHGATSALFTLLQGGWSATAPIGPTSYKHPEHIGNTTFVANKCNECHGTNANTGGHTTHRDKTLDTQLSLSYDSGNKTCTNSCHIANTANDWTAGPLACADCHDANNIGSPSTYSLDQGAWPPDTNRHPTHVGLAANAAYGDTTNHTTTSAYEFGCGSCHGNTASNHANGSPDINLSNWGSSGKTCGLNTCHSNGRGLTPAQTVDWDTGAGYTGTDKCAICHGNAPATGAHSVHEVGIHYEDIYSGGTGELGVGSTTNSAHGNNTVATTINCNICHNATVTSAANDRSGTCATASCHGTGGTTKGDAAIADKTKHVDGTRDVVFINANSFRTKAQVAGDITTVGELGNNWARSGYKAAGATDVGKPASPTKLASLSGTTCSAIVCHNGNQATWASPPAVSDCLACHTDLPE